MINFDDVIKENIKEHNPNWPESTDHSCKIVIIGGSRSGKTIPCISVNQYLRHDLGYKKIQVIQSNQIYLSSSNVSTSTTVIVKD